MPWCHKATTSTIEPGTESRRRVFAWVPPEKVIENSVAVAEAHSKVVNAFKTARFKPLLYKEDGG